MIIIVKIFFGLLLLTLLSFITGYLVTGMKKVNHNSISNLIFQILLGALLLVFITSIYLTRFKSVFIALIPLLLYISHYIRTKGVSYRFDFKRYDFLSIIISAFFAIILSYIMIKGDLTEGFKAPIKDQATYIIAAEGIQSSGIESVFSVFNELIPDVDPMPYHYYEMWLSILISNLSGFTIHFSMLGVLMSFSLFLFFLSINSIISRHVESNSLIYLFLISLISFLFIFIRGFLHYPLAIEFFWDSIFFDGNQKLIYIAPFFINIYSLLVSEKYQLALIFSLAISLLNVVFIPAMLGGVIIFLIVKLIWEHKRFMKSIFFEKWVIMTIVAFIFVFYFYLSKVVVSDGGMGIQKSLGGIFYNVLGNLKSWFIVNSIVLILIIAIIFRYKKWIEANALVFFMAVFFSGLIARGVIDNNQNAFQLITTVSLLLNYCFYLILISLLLTVFKRKQYLVLISFGIISFLMFRENYTSIRHVFLDKIYAYNSEYVFKIQRLEIKKGVGIRFANPHTRSLLMSNPAYVAHSPIFPLIKNVETTVLINFNDFIPIVNNKSEFYLNIKKEFENSALFPKLINLNLSDFSYSSYEQAVKLYIEKYKPEFCIVEEGAQYPLFLNNYIKNTIVDFEGTEEHFLLLKYD